MVERMMEIIKDINNRGTTVLLVEQMVQEALEISHRGYIIQNGRIVHFGPVYITLLFLRHTAFFLLRWHNLQILCGLLCL